MKLDDELVEFLSANRTDVKCLAAQYIVGLSGTTEGCSLIAASNQCLSSLVKLIAEEHLASRDAALSLVNVTAEQDGASKLLSLQISEQCMNVHPSPVDALLSATLRSDCPYADTTAMILSNLSRSEDGAQHIIQVMQGNIDVYGFGKTISAICNEKYNSKANLDYLGPVLSNLSQIKEARNCLLNKESGLLQQLLPFIGYGKSLIRRGGVVAAIKNCSFQTDYHEWLLSDVDILPWLLLPLAGPEEFDEDDMERLPLELQYLEESKQREADPHLRRMLVEAINQFCATKFGRNYLKMKNAYVILRELHKWEDDETVVEAIENVVSVLISDEPIDTMQDLKSVELPPAHTNCTENALRSDTLQGKLLPE